MSAFTAGLIRLRRAIPALQQDAWWQDGDGRVQWLNERAQPLTPSAWEQGGRRLQIVLSSDWLLLINAGASPCEMSLPAGDWLVSPPFEASEVLRTKPAVHFGGKFRIIDFALSNCLNSGIRRIGVITQYQSHTLVQHIQRGWSFLNAEMNEFVDLLPAQQRQETDHWYRGTADAVCQNLDIIRRYRAEYVVILAGDHIYKMDYSRLLIDHVDKQAQCTVACLPVPLKRTRLAS